ncbi:MAG: hypothetical protein LBJ65_20520 [Burkholderia sp.]|jgi:hypothetical protein|uniref:hypothetical protein n=1 Tax=Burkholderia sp. TaxID=36773 RepID=UPI002829B5A6|nr:hypothetical protein [Burkholderia sp.]MDR0243987.1 hypothetical protein [Burkholderia sp.]
MARVHRVKGMNSFNFHSFCNETGSVNACPAPRVPPCALVAQNQGRRKLTRPINVKEN